jgi:hypothetical protein
MRYFLFTVWHLALLDITLIIAPICYNLGMRKLVDGRPGSTKSFFMTSTVCFIMHKLCTQRGVHLMHVGWISLIGLFSLRKQSCLESCVVVSCVTKIITRLLAALSLTCWTNRLAFFYFPLLIDNIQLKWRTWKRTKTPTTFFVTVVMYP